MSTNELDVPVLPVFNLAHQHRPDRVVSPTSVREVEEIIAAAALAGEQVHPVGAGHGWTHAIVGGVAMLTRGLAQVQIDVDARIARVGAGTTWGEVNAATAQHGLAALCGAAPGVGVIGYLLGGGLSPVGRSYGWASDFVRSFTMVTGRGETVVATATSHSELFWALRGGKQAPGVVTGAEIELLPLATLYGGGLFYAAEDAGRVLAGFATWAATVPDEVSTSCALLRLPDLPGLPAPLRGRFVVHVRVAVVGMGAAEADAQVQPLRQLASPILDTLTEMPFGAIGAIHADPEEPMPALEAGALLRDFDVAAAEALLEVAGPQRELPLIAVELRRLGGRLSSSTGFPDAVVGRDAGYGLMLVSAPVPELFDGPIPAAVRAVATAMAPWATGTFQPNFFGALNTPASLERSWSAATLARFAAIRDTFDPSGTIGH